MNIHSATEGSKYFFLKNLKSLLKAKKYIQFIYRILLKKKKEEEKSWFL